MKLHPFVASEVLAEVVRERDVEARLVIRVAEASAEVRDSIPYRAAVSRDAMDLSHCRKRIPKVLEAVVRFHEVELVVCERIGDYAEVVYHVPAWPLETGRR